jgi:hypothetical protein
MGTDIRGLKTPDEHREFLVGLAGLKLNFAFQWYVRHRSESFPDIVGKRTFLLTLLSIHGDGIYEDPQLTDAAKAEWSARLAEWTGLAEAGFRSLDATGGGAEPGAERLAAAAAVFEAAALRRLEPAARWFDGRVGRDLEELHGPRGLAARPSPFWYRPPSAEHPAEDLPWSGGRRVALDFHIANNRYPDSFLRDPDYARAELRVLAAAAREQFGLEYLTTYTWMNGLPKWLALFPPAWTERRFTDPDEDGVGGHLGTWGQVITARQTLSASAAAALRATGRFAYAMSASWCSAAELLA